MTRQRLDIPNVTIVSLADWARDVPSMIAALQPYKLLPMSMKLFTTQHFIEPKVVAAYVERIKAGDKLSRVEVVSANGRIYVADGHHRLAAHRQLNLAVSAFLYRASIRGDIVPPPKFRGKS